jgi:hypothetical protein
MPGKYTCLFAVAASVIALLIGIAVSLHGNQWVAWVLIAIVVSATLATPVILERSKPSSDA